MKRLTLFFWGRSVLLGCVLAGLAGMTRAQLSETPTVVSQDFDITASTLRQTTPALMMSMGTGRNLTFRLDESATLTDRTIAGLEANIVPKRMKLSSITVYDTAGTLIPERFESTPVTLYKDGETGPVVTATGMERGQETVTLPTEGGMVAAVPVTFTFSSEVSVEMGVRYSLAFNWKESSVLPAVLAYPSEILGDIALPGVSLDGSTGGGYVPHVRFTGTAYIHRFILPVKKVEGTESTSLKGLLEQAAEAAKKELAGLLGGSDADAVVLVAELYEGAGLTMDTAVTEGVAFVAASYYATKSLVDHGLESTSVPTITFASDVMVTGPFTVRGGTLTGSSEPMAAELRLAGDTTAWLPTDFMLRADLRLDCPVPKTGEGNWFASHPITIASGRRLVLDHSNYTEEQLPDVTFASADSTLVLAGQNQDSSKTDIPEKYRAVLRNSSGVIALGRNATIAPDPNAGTTIEVGYNGLTHTLALLAPEATLTFPKTVSLGNGEGSSGTLYQHIGTIGGVVDGEFPGIMFASGGYGAFRQDAGEAMLGKVEIASGAEALFRVGDGIDHDGDHGTLTATTSVESLGAQRAGAAATVEVFSDGRLEIGNLSLNGAIPGMTLRGGTLAATMGATAQATFGPYDIGQDGVPESEAETLHVVGGGMLDGNGGSLTLSAVSGNGELTAKGQVTIETLWAYDGTVQAERSETGANKLTIEKILGSTGTVTVGYLGYRKDGGADDDAAALEAVTKAAAGYRGTLAFTDQYANTLDFSVLRDVIDFPYALDFSQMTTGTITMRLDQYVGTTVRWPADCSKITFNLIESGAYGGEAVIPTFPGTIHFKRYNPQGGGLLEADVPVTVTPNENGVTSDVTWNPSFTGQGAWIDVEFDGTSKNTGWFTLKGEHGEVDDALYNGLLLGNGTNHSGQQVVMTDEENAVGYVKGVFVETGHPVSKGVKLYSRPYVSYSSLTYPEAFSVVLRVMTPNVGKKCILQLGANHTSDGAGSVNGKTDSLVFATGNSGNHLVVWLVRGNSETGAMTKVAEAELANATTAAHVVSVVFDGQKFRTYLDGALLTTYTPDTAVELGTGLQVGAMLGQEDTTGDQSVGFVNRAIWAELGPVEETDSSIPNYTCGVLDYIRFYKGVLTDKAMEELTKASPPVLENVRFVRDVPGSSDFGLWVGNEQNKPWTKETWNGSTWTTGDTYAEPEEGAEIRLRVTEAGVHLLQVNVARDTMNRFYSTDRLYSTLVVEPKAGAAAGTVRLVPVGVTSADYEEKPDATAWITNNEWYTTPATKDDAQAGATFHYGRLRFLGGAKDPIHADTTISNFYGAGYLLPSGTTGVTGIFDAGVCWFSELAPFYLKATGETQPNVLQLVAGLSLTRGVDDESRTWQLTGPVTVEGTQPSEADPVQGNTVVAETAQASQDVWVAAASDAAKWTFFDRTLTEGGETNGNGETKGLFAQGLQTPGRLYLDLTDEASKEVYQKSQAFSAQKWYRYGYPGAGTATPSGMEPKEASESDFDLAIAFQVRLPEDATLNMDDVPTATVQTFFVEPAATAPADGAVAPTLSLKSDGTTQLAIQKSVIVRTPLDVSNVSESTRNPDSLALVSGVEIHRGDAMDDGKYYGAYITGNQTFDWPLGVSSVPRLEVAPHGEVTLSGPQDLRTYPTVLVVGKYATLRQADAGNTLRAAGMELGEGATFAFKSTATDGGEGAAVVGVQLDGNLTLTGNATLSSEAAGNTVFSAVAFRGPVPTGDETWAAGATLTLDVTNSATTWRIPTVAWENLGLTKTGPGTVTFSGGVSTPPTVAGMVSVNEGKLCVAPAAATAEDSSESATHSGPGIGHRGLFVAAGATLAKTDETASESAEHVLACIPNGQRLSGAGTIDGFLRLCEGATFDAAECKKDGQPHPLTVTKGLAVAGNAGANITVALPEDYEAPQPFFEVGRSESHARRRLKSMKGADQWDTVAKIEGDTTVYYAQPAGIPRPESPTDGSTDYDAAFAEQIVRYYRGDNAAYLGAAYALTQAGNYRLNEEEIVNAFRCFEGVWTFDHEKAEEAGQAEGVTYVDAQNFYMAYEFGISRVTVAPVEGLSDHALYVIAEVKVVQKVNEQWSKLERGLNRTAAFAPGVTFELWGHRPGAAVTTAEGSTSTPPHKDFTDYVKFDGVVELESFDGGPKTDGTRWFAIPYTEENFPQRTTTSLKVKVIPPATSQEEVAARLLRARDAR